MATSITQWFDKHTPTYLTYLGFPLLYPKGHREVFARSLITKINQTHYHLSFCHLTYKGRVTVCNSLFTSKIWHTLRLTPLPKWSFTPVS
ncbi:hypothetical protein BCR42DRAFT_338589 [Absidia repens]|uniref:Uncharacterized protein n=1 Tax=Absidia repens TaxID=90262 RepID=A0A1X2HXK0_9FUNG|nr:hypothetical protein BCR42DRAFT_338589 [Absidia repens]